MIDDFTPVIHELEGRDIKIWPVADVHIGAKEANVAGFRKFIDSIKDDPDSYIVICGDVCNNGLRAASCPTNVYEEIMSPSDQMHLAAEILEPVADKILGCVGGNHELRSSKFVDLDPLYGVMVLIGHPELYRQNMCFVRIKLTDGNTKSVYSLLLVHGKTANKRKQFQLSTEGIDVIVSAHLHEGVIEKPSRLVFTPRGRIKMKTIVSVQAVSWLEYGGYAARSLLLPKTTSDPFFIELGFDRSKRNDNTIHIGW